MQHVPSVYDTEQQRGGGKFPLYAILALILLALILVVVIDSPGPFTPTTVPSEAYANPELWAYQRYQFVSPAVESSVVLDVPATDPVLLAFHRYQQANLARIEHDRLTLNPELIALRNWQNMTSLAAESQFLHNNPEIGLFQRWQVEN